MTEPDAYRQLALTVAITARWAEESADLVDLVRAEGGSDDEVAAVWRDIWTLESTDLYRLLVVERGWSRRAYVQHLEHMLATTVLAEPVPRRRASRGPGGG